MTALQLQDSFPCWFHGSSFKDFSIVFLFSDWLKWNHLRSRIKRGFLDIFSRHICSTVTATIRVTNYATSFGGKNVQKTKFEAAEMILDPWKQQLNQDLTNRAVGSKFTKG